MEKVRQPSLSTKSNVTILQPRPLLPLHCHLVVAHELRVLSLARKVNVFVMNLE